MGYGKHDVQAQLWAPVRAVCEGIHLVLEARRRGMLPAVIEDSVWAPGPWMWSRTAIAGMQRTIGPTCPGTPGGWAGAVEVAEALGIAVRINGGAPVGEFGYREDVGQPVLAGGG